MILYTRTVCPKCMGVKTAIEANNLTVEIINVDENPQAYKKLEDNGISAAPVLEKDGELITDAREIFAILNA